MANTDFKGIMIRDVEFKFPKLGATYKFNTAENRSEECNPRAQGAAYSVSWTMNADAARKLQTELKQHYESCTTKAPFAKIFGMKKLDDGSFSFSAKRNGVNGQGEENPKPKVINGLKEPLEDVHIWGGSTGNIKVTAYPVTSPSGEGGISLLIDVVQVVNAVYGGSGGLDDFDTIAPVGKIQDPDLNDFGVAAAGDPFADIPKTAANDLAMDDIPF
jgi:hypothetical protein